MSKLNTNLNKTANKGFTLIELMVVIAIFLVISGVAIFDYGNFRSSISLQNLTDDIALSIRKAQGFAIGARAISGTTDFDKSYGIHFSTIAPLSSLDGSDKSFLMYYSNTTDKYYEYNLGTICGDSLNKCMEFFKISTNDVIKEIKADGAVVNSIDIAFKRPDSRAFFCSRSARTNTCDATSSISRVDITISNGQTDVSKLKTRVISVQNTGQISISQ